MNRHQRRAHASRTRKQARKDLRKVNARLKSEQAAPEIIRKEDVYRCDWASGFEKQNEGAGQEPVVLTEKIPARDPERGKKTAALWKHWKAGVVCTAHEMGLDNLAAHYSEAREDSPKS